MNDIKVLDADKLYNYILSKLVSYRSSSSIKGDAHSFGMNLLDYIEKNSKQISEFAEEDK